MSAAALPGFAKAGAFLRRDALMAASYRFTFALQAVQIVLTVAMAYYLAEFLRRQGLESVAPFARSYFPFVILGLAFWDLLGAALDSFSRAVREAQLTGTLEALAVTPTSLEAVLFGSSLYPFLAASARVGVYLAAGVLWFGLPLEGARWGTALVLLLLSLAAFSSLGLLAACFVLVFHKGNPVTWVVLGASGLAGGVFYPVAALPPGFGLLAQALPLTHCLEGMRRALLGGESFSTLWPQTLALAVFAGVGLPVSLALFRWSVGHARRRGTLGRY